jgi:hypothetical protein
MAEQVVLQLILNRAKIRALVKDAAAAKQGFGPYIEPVQGDSGDRAALKRLLKGAQAAVVCGPLGALLPAAAATKLPHIVLLSSAGAPQQGFSLFASAEQRALSDAQREAAVKQSGLSYTVVRVASLAGVPGGASRLALTGEASVGQFRDCWWCERVPLPFQLQPACLSWLTSSTQPEMEHRHPRRLKVGACLCEPHPCLFSCSRLGPAPRPGQP